MPKNWHYSINPYLLTWVIFALAFQNVPKASFPFFKDLDFEKEFCKFKAQCTTSLPTYDMFHLLLASKVWEPWKQNVFDMWRKNERKKSKAAQSISCPHWELLLGWEFSEGNACATNRNCTEEKKQDCLLCEIPIHFGWR